MGMINRPPTANWSVSVTGGSGVAAATMMPA
jgi:hypothetical protein